MGTEKFFDETSEQSAIKAEIVEKYFDAWAQIIARSQNTYDTEKKLAYIDLFAGPGRYKDGAMSTPLKVLQKAINNDLYRERLVTYFNDKDAGNAHDLETAINALPGIEKLKYTPSVMNEEIGSSIAAQFEKMNIVPTLAFIDPWGYKGLSLQLVNAFLKDWGCDCIFFFNYRRINAGLSNPRVKEHMAALFGDQRAAMLTSRLEPLGPAEREALIVEKLGQALKSLGHRYVLPFCFKDKRGTRTTHHLVIVTKHFKGYEVMKDIMAKASSSSDQGVPSFAYAPATGMTQGLLFSLNRPLDTLRDDLLVTFAGQTLTMKQVYEQHSIDTPYIAKNYKEALGQLERDGKIVVVGRKINKNGALSMHGFPDRLSVRFPKRKK